MQINVIEPDIITLADRLASFDRLYVNLTRKRPDFTFSTKSTKHVFQAARGCDAIEAGAHIDANMVR